MAFIDFDKIPRAILWNILEQKGLNKKMNTVQSLYKNTTNLIIYKKLKSKMFKT